MPQLAIRGCPAIWSTTSSSIPPAASQGLLAACGFWLRVRQDEGGLLPRRRWGIGRMTGVRYDLGSRKTFREFQKRSHFMKNNITDWGQLRFSIIGGLLARPPEPGKLGEEIKILASRCYRHPREDKWVTFGASTIERWYYRALHTDDPVAALSRKIRSDCGETKAMSAQLQAALEHQYRNYPHWSYQLHADNLVALVKEKPELGDAPSYSTVRRRMKERGWRKKRQAKTAGQRQAAARLEQREVRSYEAEYVHGLWHLDFHTGSRRVVDAKGNYHSPKALCVLDDCSRLCCHIQWYLDETAESLIHGLSQAFQKRGLPRSLMTDNGSAMLARETRNGLAQLGIEHETTLPYSAYQNGKQDSWKDG